MQQTELELAGHFPGFLIQRNLHEKMKLELLNAFTSLNTMKTQTQRSMSNN